MISSPTVKVGFLILLSPGSGPGLIYPTYSRASSPDALNLVILFFLKAGRVSKGGLVITNSLK